VLTPPGRLTSDKLAQVLSDFVKIPPARTPRAAEIAPTAVVDRVAPTVMPNSSGKPRRSLYSLIILRWPPGPGCPDNFVSSGGDESAPHSLFTGQQRTSTSEPPLVNRPKGL